MLTWDAWDGPGVVGYEGAAAFQDNGGVVAVPDVGGPASHELRNVMRPSIASVGRHSSGLASRLKA